MSRSRLLVSLPEPCLVVMVGAASAGKSTLARLLVGQHPTAAVVSYDACRAELSGDPGNQDVTPAAVHLAHTRITQRAALGLTTVADGTHTHQPHRQQLLDIATTHHLPTVAIALTTPLQVCLARQHHRPPAQPGTRWGRQVPTEVVTTQHAEVTAALPGLHREGYTAVHILTTTTA